MKKLLLLIVILPCVSACVPVAVVAGAAAGGAVVYNNRSMETMLHDRNITYKAQLKINTDPQLKNKTHISVATLNGTVLLVGQAPTEKLRARALNLVKTVAGIKRIYNQITIEAPTSALTRSSDSWITTKVKTAMLAERGLKSTQIKVVTENGTVYLMGLITPNQGNLAAKAARRVDGVQRVIKVFEYLR